MMGGFLLVFFVLFVNVVLFLLKETAPLLLPLFIS